MKVIDSSSDKEFKNKTTEELKQLLKASARRFNSTLKTRHIMNILKDRNGKE